MNLSRPELRQRLWICLLLAIWIWAWAWVREDYFPLHWMRTWWAFPAIGSFVLGCAGAVYAGLLLGKEKKNMERFDIAIEKARGKDG